MESRRQSQHQTAVFGNTFQPLGRSGRLEVRQNWRTASARFLVVDNSLLSPVGSQPLKHGADISVSSATKSRIDGHGRVMGGVLAMVPENC